MRKEISFKKILFIKWFIYYFSFAMNSQSWDGGVESSSPLKNVKKAFGSVVVPIPFFFSSYVPPQPRPVGEEPNLLRLKYTFWILK